MAASAWLLECANVSRDSPGLSAKRMWTSARWAGRSTCAGKIPNVSTNPDGEFLTNNHRKDNLSQAGNFVSSNLTMSSSNLFLFFPWLGGKKQKKLTPNYLL